MHIPRAVYVHIPFCRAKCFYCDFNSYPGEEGILGDYVRALISEIRTTPLCPPLSRGEDTPSPPAGEGWGEGYPPLLAKEGLGEVLLFPPFGRGDVRGVYFGGGTPTVLPADDLISVLSALEERFGLSPDAEVTIEANPGTVDAASLTKLRRGGFNRLSIGVQSFDDDTLTRLGRIHTADDAREAFRLGRSAGFDNISIDLMYALPEHSLSDWRRTLDSALDLAPEHISLYELTVEEGTVFGNLRKRCQLNLPDQDAQLEMYIAAIETLTAAGYEHYEISNFALPGRRSLHNQTYWRNEPYFGFGAGASGYIGGVRYTNLRSPKAYIESVRTSVSAVEFTESVTGRQAMGETVMLGLRMLDGLDLAAFEARFGARLTDVYAEEVSRFIDQDLLELTDTHLRLTRSGLFVANEVAAEFL